MDRRTDFLADYERIPFFGSVEAEEPDERNLQNRPRDIVDGRDNRELVTDMNMIPFCFIGQVIARSSRARDYMRLGTVFLIGPEVVATAGHNMYVQNQPADRWDIYFQVNGDRRARHVYHYRAMSAAVHPNYNPRDRQSRYDVATMRIEPVGSSNPLPSNYGFLRVVTATPGQTRGQVGLVTGYPSKVPEPYRGIRSDTASQYYNTSTIINHSGGRIFYPTDTSQGQSGAPLVIRVRDDNGQEGASAAVGIHVLGRATATSNAAVAMETSIIDFLFGASVA